MGRATRNFSHFILLFAAASFCLEPLALAARRGKSRQRLLKDFIELNPTDITWGAGKAPDMGNSDSAHGGSGAGSGAKKNTGNGNGTGTGEDLTFNEGAAKGQGAPSENGSGDRRGKPPSTKSKDGQGQLQVFDKYWPMCMFFDPSVSSAQANEIVKGTVDMAAKCRVNLFIQAVTVKPGSYTEEPDEFNPKQQASCNMQSVGISDASTLLVSRFDLAAAKMCQEKDEMRNGQPGMQTTDWDAGIAGCAQLREGGGISAGQLASMKSGGSFGGMGGGILPSVIVPIGHSAGVASHEALGHSQMGWPNMGEEPDQIDAGLGIGSPGKGGTGSAGPNPIVSASEGGNATGGWTAAGCAQMQKMAQPNTKKIGWDPNQQNYFNIEKNPEFWWTLGEPLWGPKPPKPPSGPPPIVRIDKKNPPFDEELVMVDPGKTPPEESAGPGSRHKKKPGDTSGDGAIDQLLTSLRKNGERGGSEAEAKRNIPPTDGGVAGDSSSLTFNEDAKKAGEQTGDASNTNSGTIANDDPKGGNSKNGSSDGSTSKEGVRDLASEGGAAGRVGAGKPTQGALFDESFFSSITKAEKKRNRRTKGETLRQLIREKLPKANGRPLPRGAER